MFKFENKVDSIKKAMALKARAEGLIDQQSFPSRKTKSEWQINKTTFTQKTFDSYHSLGEALLKRFVRDCGVGFPIDYWNYLLTIKPTVKQSTWRMYRHAAWVIVDNWDIDTKFQTLYQIDQDIQFGGIKRDKIQKRAAALKAKIFKADDFNKIICYLRNFSKSKVAPIVIDWLRAGIITGLRPIEWRSTSLQDNKLYIVNAKSSNSGGNGKVRTLDLSQLSDSDQSCISRMSENGAYWQAEGIFEKMKKVCALVLKHTQNQMKALKRKDYTLYSCRHQAISNWKRTYTREQVSALAGHAVTKTAISKYGRKSSGWISPTLGLVVPMIDEVKTVRNNIKPHSWIDTSFPHSEHTLSI